MERSASPGKTELKAGTRSTSSNDNPREISAMAESIEAPSRAQAQIIKNSRSFHIRGSHPSRYQRNFRGLSPNSLFCLASGSYAGDIISMKQTHKRRNLCERI